MEEISELRAWWEGPAFLFDSQSNWPQLNMVFNSDNDMTELRRKYVIGKNPSTCIATHLSSTATLLNDGVCTGRLQPNRFSSWKRLTRVVSWILRFINNCRKESKLDQVELSAEEMSDAEH